MPLRLLKYEKEKSEIIPAKIIKAPWINLRNFAAVKLNVCEMKKIVTTMTMLTLMTACSSDGAGARAEAADDVPTGFEIQYTMPVPSEFFQAASQQGTIELLEYDSRDYTSSSRPATRKPAYVYLPYGYDPTQKYDVIYLLHGWTGVAQEYFLGRSWNGRSSQFCPKITSDF